MTTSPCTCSPPARWRCSPRGSSVSLAERHSPITTAPMFAPMKIPIRHHSHPCMAVLHCSGCWCRAQRSTCGMPGSGAVLLLPACHGTVTLVPQCGGASPSLLELSSQSHLGRSATSAADFFDLRQNSLTRSERGLCLAGGSPCSSASARRTSWPGSSSKRTTAWCAQRRSLPTWLAGRYGASWRTVRRAAGQWSSSMRQEQAAALWSEIETRLLSAGLVLDDRRLAVERAGFIRILGGPVGRGRLARKTRATPTVATSTAISQRSSELPSRFLRSKGEIDYLRKQVALNKRIDEALADMLEASCSRRVGYDGDDGVGY